ncbi:lipocalin-like domain-containing protein [Acaryochloris sp. IP29b_bin.137]|uniref:lipocalin-like domain-containing protein n=1 Tax=Acaryochloris sp. IP29b_bin.137 TaxID=2969217 RepID=UPI0026345FE3|nr:lipocalin-like domain-containing protein [Acaryochloris sp. IP29b_bin.137]
MQRWLGWLISFVLGLFVMGSPAWAMEQGTVEWAGPAEIPEFQKATVPIKLSFPKDFGPHEDYQTEWWYYTGNLETESGRLFGYELTLFRRGLTPGLPDQQGSAWRSNQVYFSHFTLSDIENQQFYPVERFNRGAAELAGAQANPYRIWLDDWSVEEVQPGQLQLHAQGPETALNLQVSLTTPVLQGNKGLFVKGSELGNAAYYYSVVQQPTQGTVTVQGETLTVSGSSWTDHEFATRPLSQGTQGWDWFSLQLEDGSVLMLYGLRSHDGSDLPESSGTFINAEGKVLHLNGKDYQLQVLDRWTSPQSRTQYPSKWVISVPKLDLEMQVAPMMNNQELLLSTKYWEGAVSISGTQSQQPIWGKGYVELTGYDRELSF